MVAGYFSVDIPGVSWVESEISTSKRKNVIAFVIESMSAAGKYLDLDRGPWAVVVVLHILEVVVNVFSVAGASDIFLRPLGHLFRTCHLEVVVGLRGNFLGEVLVLRNDRTEGHRCGLGAGSVRICGAGGRWRRL